MRPKEPAMLRTFQAAVLAAVIGLLGLGTSSAQAACGTSTPASTSFPDSIGDSSLAPDITTVTASVSATCTVSVDPGISGPLIAGESVAIYVDSDGNASTGSSVPQGMEWIVLTSGT